MITNKEQYKITKSKLEDLIDSLDSFDTTPKKKLDLLDVIIKTEKDSLQSQINDLTDQISKYKSTIKISKYKCIVTRQYWHVGSVIVEACDQDEAQEEALDKISDAALKIGGHIEDSDMVHVVEEVD